MSYELRRGEKLSDSLHRICREQLDRVLAIAKGERETADTPVHETRKCLKKTRAALRLVRKEIGRGQFREHDHALRDVGRLISDIRDAEVRLQTVRQLEGFNHRRGRTAGRGLEAMFLLELENFMAAFAGWQAKAIPMLKNVRAAIDGWPLDHFDAKQLRRAVQASYKRARVALAEAKACPSSERLHELRREAKVLWYQLRILRPINPAVLNMAVSELNSLGDLLGRAHDLSFLGERLRAEHGHATWQREGHKLLGVIEVSEADLQRNAAELAELFFCERPRNFGSGVAAWLEDWATISPRATRKRSSISRPVGRKFGNGSASGTGPGRSD